METWIVWLIITALFVLVELLTSFIATFCLAVGSLLAMVISLFGGIEWQLGALTLGTVIAFIFFAPFIRRMQERRGKTDNRGISNMDALRGRVAQVVEAIPTDGSCGRVRVDGDRWQARSVDGNAFAVGDRVRVVDYDSIILDVESIN